MADIWHNVKRRNSHLRTDYIFAFKRMELNIACYSLMDIVVYSVQ